jgi:hypothetical protein
VVWLGLIVSSCGGGGGGGGGAPSGPVAIDDFGARYVDVICAGSARCGLYPDAATCKRVLVEDFGQLVADVKAGKISYDDAKGGACLGVLAGVGCRESDADQNTTACDEAFKGTKAEGAACVTPAQCVSGGCDFSGCSATAACCAGKCLAAPPTVAEGAACDGTSHCATGAVCDGGTCKRPGGRGATCRGPFQCQAGLACVTQIGATSGTCGSFPATGQACNTSGGACDSVSDYCDSVTNKCTKRLAVGATCASTDQGCVYYAFCDPSTSKCVAFSELDGSCLADGDCLGTLLCLNGKCAAPTPATVCP